jgi:hypothetical protein
VATLLPLVSKSCITNRVNFSFYSGVNLAPKVSTAPSILVPIISRNVSYASFITFLQAFLSEAFFNKLAIVGSNSSI